MSLGHAPASHFPTMWLQVRGRADGQGVDCGGVAGGVLAPRRQALPEPRIGVDAGTDAVALPPSLRVRGAVRQEVIRGPRGEMAE